MSLTKKYVTKGNIIIHKDGNKNGEFVFGKAGILKESHKGKVSSPFMNKKYTIHNSELPYVLVPNINHYDDYEMMFSVWLHEIGHIICKHYENEHNEHNERESYLIELEAEEYSLSQLKKIGVNNKMYQRMEEQAKNNVFVHCARAIYSGTPLSEIKSDRIINFLGYDKTKLLESI